MRRHAVFTLTTLLALCLAGSVAAKELRVAYVDSDRILESNEDFKQARQTLQDEERQYADQATTMEQGVRSMGDELQAQSLMLSDEAKQERAARFAQKRDELDKFRRDIWGEGGRLYARNLELSKPVLEKINAAIQKVSQELGYDLVFDAASANIVYAVPELDITDKVLDELKKE